MLEREKTDGGILTAKNSEAEVLERKISDLLDLLLLKAATLF